MRRGIGEWRDTRCKMDTSDRGSLVCEFIKYGRGGGMGVLTNY